MGVGPRIGRVHVGSGRPGISSGLGPATVWTGVGPAKRRSTRGRGTPRSQTSIRAYQAAARRADRLDEVRALMALELSLTAVHRHEFAPAEPAKAPPPAPFQTEPVHRHFKREELRGVSWFAFSERRAATARARAAADAEIRAEQARREARSAAAQAELDEEWSRLVANDPATVMHALEAAFDDNEAPAVPIDCHGDGAAIVMVYPDVGQIPESKPAVTPSGQPTVHKRTQTERNELYAQSLASNVLATVREAFAVAPSLANVAVLTVCKDDSRGGIPMVTALALVVFGRPLVERFDWNRLDPLRTLELGDPCLLARRGRTGELAPLDLSGEPEIAAVLESFADMLELRIDPGVKLPGHTE
jgi:hypothetical protein